jgi:4-amino-4-deoxy-L-arabinose transferase-like glycosyltransferase
METLLHASLVLLVLWKVGSANGRGWFWIGLLAGLGVWIRPDAITLLGPAGLVLLLCEPGWKKRLAGLAWLGAGAAVFFLPYLLFNLQVQGSLWPNTFYAKQAEYATHRQAPLLLRFWDELKLPLVGAGIFLLPGFAACLAQSVKSRNWPILGAAAWFFGYALLYALRLPVTYQYGRYFMPAMPVYFLLGLAGSFLLLGRLRHRRTGGVSRAGWRAASWLMARVALLSGADLAGLFRHRRKPVCPGCGYRGNRDGRYRVVDRAEHTSRCAGRRARYRRGGLFRPAPPGRPGRADLAGGDPDHPR